MRMRLIGFAVALGFGAAQSVSAADLPVKAPVYKAPPMTPAYNWSGCYIGGQVGYGWVRDKNSETVTATGAASVFSPTDTADPSGLKVGGMLGCNWQWSGPFVVGLEGDGEWADINGGSVTFPGSGPPDDFYEARIRWQASARGRIGYAFDRTLLYATGGAAFADIRHIYTVAATGLSEAFTTTKTGWTVGGGVEHAFAPNWTARVEYRYSDFGTISNLPVTTFAGLTESHNMVEHAVRFGLAYKFFGAM
jgi:outer membrane immunogenic protein